MTLLPDNEAACLLQKGNLYRSRVALQSNDTSRELIFAGLKAGAFSVYSGDQPYVHFDLDGRWQRAFIEDIHYLKGLDGTVQAIDRVREGQEMVLDRRKLSYAESADLDAFIRSFILDLTAEIDAERLTRIDPPAGKNVTSLVADELRDLLDRVAAWDAAAWFAHRERYLSTYGAFPLIPPDSQGAIILQATLGNATGRAFGLAKPAVFHARVMHEFEQHCREVSRLLGRRVADSRSVLLLGADLFHQSIEMIMEYMKITCHHFVDRPIHATLDNFPPTLPVVESWKQFHELGLERVTLEIESGDPDVRANYHVNWRDAELVETARAIKAAGIGLSVLTLVAPGGGDGSGQHVERTGRLIELLELGRGDLVFLLDEREVMDVGPRPPQVSLLPEGPWNEQQRRLGMELGSLKDRGVKVVPYTVEKQRT